MTKIEPGWYRDPAAPETQRYWDGEQWVGKPVGIDETPPDEPEPLPPPEPEPVTPPVDPVQVDSPPRYPTGSGGFLPRLEPKSIERVMAGRTLAHPGQRFVARLVDVVVVSILATIVNSWFIYQYFQALTPAVRKLMANPDMDVADVVPDRAFDLQFLMLFITILVWFAYEVPSTVKSGQTVGKRLMGVAVVPLGSSPLRWSHAIARWSLMMLALACFPFGLALAVIDGLWCLRDKPFRQCIHDKNAGTMVINMTHSKGDDDVPSDSR